MNDEMTYSIEDFVGVFDNILDADFCSMAIEKIEQAIENGYGFDRRTEGQSPINKDDTTVACFSTKIPYIESIFHAAFWEAYRIYADKYAVLTSGSETHTIYENRFQKTEVGQGYHIWHYESASRGSAPRLLAYTLYLNDVEEGGETEFLYYPRRVAAKQGRLCIFPTAFSHTHRGNPPLSNTKYIITGWVEF